MSVAFLDVNVLVALFDPALWVPDVIGDLTKNAVADHHPRATRLIMVEPNESAVTILGVEIGPIAREDVGVQIDLHVRLTVSFSSRALW